LSHCCFYIMSRCSICCKTSSEARHTCFSTIYDWKNASDMLYSYAFTPLERRNMESAWTASFSRCCFCMYDTIITLLCSASHVLHRLILDLKAPNHHRTLFLKNDSP
jgi:hypothetical protein